MHNCLKKEINKLLIKFAKNKKKLIKNFETNQNPELRN